jgi:hypothetical protein
MSSISMGSGEEKDRIQNSGDISNAECGFRSAEYGDRRQNTGVRIQKVKGL